MKVVVGSTNPVKVKAVTKVFEHYFPGCEVVGLEVASGVSGQPMTEEETITGARNRAQAALVGADYGVGLEGGVCELEGQLFECAWVVVADNKGKEGMGGGLYFELPPVVAERIRSGEELGPIMAEIMKYDVKRTDGAIGVLTKGALTRQQAYEQIVKSALVKFVSAEWFENR